MLIEAVEAGGHPKHVTGQGGRRRQHAGRDRRRYSVLSSANAEDLASEADGQRGQRVPGRHEPRAGPAYARAAAPRPPETTPARRAGRDRLAPQVAGGPVQQQRVRVQPVLDQLAEPGREQVGIQVLAGAQRPAQVPRQAVRAGQQVGHQHRLGRLARRGSRRGQPPVTCRSTGQTLPRTHSGLRA